MCKLKSAIVLKDRIFMPDYDSHERMIKELGLKDDYLGASKTFVRVELSPENGDVFSAIENWKLTVDQDIRPEWFSEDECKLLLIEKVKEWATTHILVGIDDTELSGESVCYIKDCKNVTACDSSSVTAYGSSSVTAYDSSSVTACDSSSVTAYDSSSVTAYDSSSVTAYGSSSVKACGSSSVTAYDSSSVKACGSSSVTAYGSSSVTAYGSSSVTAYGSSVITNSLFLTWKKQDDLMLKDRSTFKDNHSGTIYQAGAFKFVPVDSGKAIGEQKGI